MGFKIRTKDLNSVFEKLNGSYKIVAPKVVEGAGRCSETDVVRYEEVKTVEEIELYYSLQKMNIKNQKQMKSLKLFS